MKLLVVLPTIRLQNLPRFYDSFIKSIDDLASETQLVCIGPEVDKLKDFLEKEKIGYTIDFGSPTRCVQKIIANNHKFDYITWTTDDAIYTPGALSKFIKKLDSYTEEKVFGCVKYTEDGPPNWVTGADDHYYIAGIHDSLKNVPGVDKNHKLAMVGVYPLEAIIDTGGLDCRYDHINLSTHDLAFRAQRLGYKCILSDDVIMHCNSNPMNEDHRALDRANITDYNKFLNHYSVVPELTIDPNNWMSADKKWDRFK